ncbi:MAG: penicillin-binding protein 2 [Gammaproteobacteria bacterium]|nr:penicillin-binding protein 2 [Gammaproteobacteria bacterium]
MTGEKRKKRAATTLRREQVELPRFRARRWTLVTLLWIAGAAVIWRAVDQQIFDTDFLQHEGERRHLRVVDVPAHRGMILDRRGEPLAVSTPVDSISVNPRVINTKIENLSSLAKTLGQDVKVLQKRLRQRQDRSFMYLKRRVNPDLSEKVMQVVRSEKLAGVELQREYRRFYPSGEVFAHVVGFTDIDDQGQEGMELAFNDWLSGTSGSKRVIRDGRARVVADVENIQSPRPGQTLTLSLDWRVQFMAYRALKVAVNKHKARSGSVVVLDVETGEVLAMVNQPAFNPNGSKHGGGRIRNRAMTDLFEPGSTIKPFVVASALENGLIQPETKINTTPGRFKVGKNLIKDIRNYGVIDIATVIRKSSNVGISKIALGIPPVDLWESFLGLGFGTSTNSGFPGEVGGRLAAFDQWSKFDHATLAFGYGLSVTPLQLARAYSVLASDGLSRPVTIQRRETAAEGTRVFSASTARTVRSMLEAVVSSRGTAPAAAIKGYRVAGKTGTVRKSISGGYSEDRFFSVFAGMAPATNPRLVAVVMIDEPSAGKYYGGQVAAPVFSKVMGGALRLLNISPDEFSGDSLRLAKSEGGR